MSKITLQSTISIVENRCIGSKIGEELMLMDLTTGDYININQVGAIIWELIQTPISVANVCQELMSKCEVDEITCQKDTILFLEEMLEKGIINLS